MEIQKLETLEELNKAIKNRAPMIVLFYNQRTEHILTLYNKLFGKYNKQYRFYTVNLQTAIGSTDIFNRIVHPQTPPALMIWLEGELKSSFNIFMTQSEDKSLDDLTTLLKKLSEAKPDIITQLKELDEYTNVTDIILRRNGVREGTIKTILDLIKKEREFKSKNNYTG